jgi:DNA phosphorothioation-dependent restriction protein DptH
MDEYNVVVGLPAAGSSSFRDELVEKDEALGLFVVLLQMFAGATYDGRQFNKLVVFDEAHKVHREPRSRCGAGRGRSGDARHKGTSIVVASQDPPSVPGNKRQSSPV